MLGLTCFLIKHQREYFDIIDSNHYFSPSSEQKHSRLGMIMSKLQSYTNTLFIVLFVLQNACNPALEEASGKSAKQGTMSMADDGAWCWFSDPRAVFFQGTHRRTYSGWVDHKGSIVVGYYDHDTDSIVNKILHKELQVDDHNNPSFHIDPSGRLLVFYSKHSNKDPIYLARAKIPESIDQWEPVQELALNDSSLFENASNTYTYTNVVQLSEESDKLYLFWRGVDFKPNFSTSADHGVSWSTGDILVLPDRIYSNRRPYLKVSSNNRDVIHFAFTDGHPRNEPTNSIYYFRYQNGVVQKADGSSIKSWADLPVSPSESDLVYDARLTNEKAWIWDVAGDANDQPVMVYSRFPNDSTHIYYYAFWQGDQWENIELVNSGGWFPQTPEGEIEREQNYSGGMALDHSNPAVVYLSIEKNGVFEIEKWETRDLGTTWEVTEITSNSKYSNIRPFAVRNRPDEYDTMVLWMNFQEYLHYTDFNSSIRMNFE